MFLPVTEPSCRPDPGYRQSQGYPCGNACSQPLHQHLPGPGWLLPGCPGRIKAALASGKSTKELEKELSKTAGEEGFYLEKDRAYRSEDDVFEVFTPEERDQYFGKPPATVWENMKAFDAYPEKVAVLTQAIF